MNFTKDINFLLFIMITKDTLNNVTKPNDRSEKQSKNFKRKYQKNVKGFWKYVNTINLRELQIFAIF